MPIPAGLADKLCMAAAGRALSAPLLASGAPRGTSDHARPFKRAAGVIGEDAGRVSSYALRHSHITAQLLAGLPVLASHTSELVRGAMVDFDRRPGGDAIFFGGEPLSKCLY